MQPWTCSLVWGALLPMTQLLGCMLPASQKWDGCVSQPQLYQWVGLVTWSGLQKTNTRNEDGVRMQESMWTGNCRDGIWKDKIQARNRESWLMIWEKDFFGSSCKTPIHRANNITLQGYEILGKKKLLTQSRSFKGCKGGDYHRQTIWMLPLFWYDDYTQR